MKGRKAADACESQALENEEGICEATMDFTLDELREFLEADFLEVDADPAFKESLREKLWEMVKSNLHLRGRDP